MTDETAAQLRAGIRRDAKQLKKLEGDVQRVTARRDERMKKARGLGVTAVELAEDAGLTPGRVSHIAPKPEKEDQDQEDDAPPPVLLHELAPLDGDELPPAFRAGAATGITNYLSEYATDRWAKAQPERATIFVDLEDGYWSSPTADHGRIHWDDYSANELLTQLPEGVERVFLVGGRPGVREETANLFDSEADAVRLWFLTPVPGWEVQQGGHYLYDVMAPVGRWQQGNGDRARRVEVARAATWFGEGEYAAATAARAWWTLRRMIAAGFGQDAILLSTPATTGRDMWRRTIGKTRDGKAQAYPVLSDELRQLIQSTSGQGRREIVEGPPEIKRFVQYDMRFAYAALSWGMPVGEPVMTTARGWAGYSQEDQDRALKMRGRWLVRATVPPGWRHVGILGAPARGADRLWTYPRRPGQTFTTWASGSEIELARRYGWQLEVLEGFTFKEGKPLNVWKDKLVSMYQAAERGELEHCPPDIRAMIRAALRMMVLTTIGAFATRTHKVTRSTPVTPDAVLPTNVPVREVEGVYIWEEEGQVSEWNKRLAHPEWSAEIWARCRVRLLDAPTGFKGQRAGALNVRPEDVLGMRTDALYLAVDPGWDDDGEPGRYRLKGRLDIRGQMIRPRDDAQLGKLKDAAEAALSKGEK